MCSATLCVENADVLQLSESLPLIHKNNQLTQTPLLSQSFHRIKELRLYNVHEELSSFVLT